MALYPAELRVHLCCLRSAYADFLRVWMDAAGQLPDGVPRRIFVTCRKHRETK
jgi:hypothetical protein